MKAARWLSRALPDLEDAYSYISADDPAAAARLIDQVEEGAVQLARHPRTGRVGRLPGTRELVIAGTPFIVAYRVVGSQVEILAVLHGARRWPKRL